MIQQPRVPVTCPPGFLGRYTVRPGDTFFRIAQFFRTRLEALAVNNPHIADPNLIFPGDVLCVPGLIPFPCCAVLQPFASVPFGAIGTVLAHISSGGTNALSFMAKLPSPSTFGSFDSYLGRLEIPNVAVFNTVLFATPEDPPTWSGTIDLPTVAQITPDTRASVHPYNSATGVSGNTVLFGSLFRCNR